MSRQWDDGTVQQICDDFVAEAEALDGIVSDDGVDFDRPTPAPGWSIGDQISHLWFFDQRAHLALTDPEAFLADAETLLADSGAGTHASVQVGRSMVAEELCDAWRADRVRLIAAARDVDPTVRVRWYGPPMGARSFITARLMETWAHGQDIVDALGIGRAATDRLRHVAHIGVGARVFSYLANARPAPTDPVRVELRGPTADLWTWGPEEAADRVSGDALDFCLVVTQRRHLDDVTLVIDGAGAQEWMSIAQSFAGPPGPGRQPGQFER